MWSMTVLHNNEVTALHTLIWIYIRAKLIYLLACIFGRYWLITHESLMANMFSDMKTF